jgi:outer membrane lipopolysaccharide assembly protein LptE/RlpB
MILLLLLLIMWIVAACGWSYRWLAASSIHETLPLRRASAIR